MNFEEKISFGEDIVKGVFEHAIKVCGIDKATLTAKQLHESQANVQTNMAMIAAEFQSMVEAQVDDWETFQKIAAFDFQFLHHGVAKFMAMMPHYKEEGVPLTMAHLLQDVMCRIELLSIVVNVLTSPSRPASVDLILLRVSEEFRQKINMRKEVVDKLMKQIRRTIETGGGGDGFSIEDVNNMLEKAQAE